MLSLYMTIEDFFGIELTWKEKDSLSNYLDSFAKIEEGTSAWIVFMIDYFGLDPYELGKINIPENFKSARAKSYGPDFLGTEEFKQYCKNNVDFWRDQRNLL